MQVHPRGRLIAFALAAGLVGLPLASLTAKGAADSREIGLKAAFLYKFASLTTWPESAFGGADGAFRIGVVADSSFAAAQRIAVSGKRIHGRSVEVELLREVPAADRFHVLYLPRQSAGVMDDLLRLSESEAVLTIGDAPDFVERGGIIQLDRDGRHMRFSINRGAAARSDLLISSKLLMLAERVIDRDGD